MFNVIKGNLINKNVKAVQISTERIVKEVAEKIQALDNGNAEDYENTSFVNEVENELLLEELEERILEKKKELESIHIEAIEIIENAKLEAQEIINNGIYQGEQESQSIKEKAWNEGYNEGLEQARRDMEENITSVLISANKILNEASLKSREAIKENSQEIIELAVLIAEKVIKTEIGNKEVLFNNVLDAIKKVQTSKEIKIYVNWNQLEYKDELIELLKYNFQGLELIEIIEDRTIEQGGCIIETKLGKIDATIKSQIELILDSVSEV